MSPEKFHFVPEKEGHFDVLTFDRTNPEQDRKFRDPIKIEDLKSQSELISSGIPLDLCKKDPVTKIQIRFRCNACRCQIESVGALKEHIQGQEEKFRMVLFFASYYLIGIL